jgi:hypothetical protein
MNHKQLVQQMADMKAELDKYQAELTTLRSQVSAYENVEEAPAPAATTSSRRKLLKRMAIAGIGGIGALGLAASVGSNNTVLAETAADNAIEAVGGSAGYGLRASGGLAPIFLVGSGTGAPTGGTHQAGELYSDTAGSLYFCVSGGAPGTWRQLSGTNTAGVFHTLPSPDRFVNNVTLTKDVPQTFNMTNVNGVSGNPALRIPTGATAIVGNVTVVQSTASGFLSLYPTGSSIPTTSNVNYPAANAVVGNNFTVGLSSTGQLNAVAQGANAHTVHIYIDVFGYYL